MQGDDPPEQPEDGEPLEAPDVLHREDSAARARHSEARARHSEARGPPQGVPVVERPEKVPSVDWEPSEHRQPVLPEGAAEPRQGELEQRRAPHRGSEEREEHPERAVEREEPEPREPSLHCRLAVFPA